ncbi:sulfatase-like hydrolase/transferase [Wenyingzhuangia aestuarii]|uniref:sulfatase-like hydrolase/transferase n=1 Tax=Wenyingzhuangia aestuarii TaxID=1647582 RepID=UPI00143BB963|nr:sulfatase-like hydrolase/transferase [Wenyingzhuangia aestuarii]NJB83529.1 arylsulfatase A-like enzyme [Wenyingzhuangia aestuarii]
MKLNKAILLCLLAFIFLPKTTWAQKQQPNVLWILTDDQRYDAIRAFNKMIDGKEMSKLGYVESPNVDKLTKEGTTFINTYCQATGCAPSRASMHYGRYPFRSGVYEFEYHNNNASSSKPTLPEQMATLGYETLHIGKLGVRLKTKEGGKLKSAKMYQQDISFKELRKDGLTGWGKDWFDEINGEKIKRQNVEFFVTEEGEFQYISKELENKLPNYKGTAKKAMEEYDLLRHYNKKKGPLTPFTPGILAGVSSRKAGETRDGYYTQFFKKYLDNENKKFKAGSREFKGVNPDKPLFCQIGFDFPHTPVLPPASYRERFKKHTYNVPSFDKKELETMPKQLKKQVEAGYSDHFKDAEKQKMIQDYYAFCAYGDALVGQAVDDFVAYSKSKNQPYMIVYVCGDHGWKLNDHGSVSKFSSWDIDSHNPIVVVSSDKKAFPAGKVVKDFTEFVDIAPTIMAAGGADLEKSEYAYLDGLDMQKVASKEAPKRDYIVGESHAVTGPRAYIRTKDYVFSMQTRPTKKRGEDMNWALNASYKELDPALYYMKKDPHEINNLAFDKKYAKIAKQMKEKLINIVLGDNRVEVNWGKRGDGTQVFHSNFAPGAHDYKLILKK